jgi:hypothetical protein
VREEDTSWRSLLIFMMSNGRDEAKKDRRERGFAKGRKRRANARRAREEGRQLDGRFVGVLGRFRKV